MSRQTRMVTRTDVTLAFFLLVSFTFNGQKRVRKEVREASELAGRSWLNVVRVCERESSVLACARACVQSAQAMTGLLGAGERTNRRGHEHRMFTKLDGIRWNLRIQSCKKKMSDLFTNGLNCSPRRCGVGYSISSRCTLVSSESLTSVKA